MGEQSFTNQGETQGERPAREVLSGGADMPSFRPLAAPSAIGPAGQPASATPEAAVKPSVDKRHFFIREDNRAAPLAPSRSPSLPDGATGGAVKRWPRKSRTRAVIRACLTLAIGASIGYVAAYSLSGPAHLVGAETTRAPAERWSPATLAAAIDQAERQIAEERLEAPAGDNALETYRRIAARSPGGAETRSLGEHLSLAFWSLGVAATEKGDWAEATRYFEIVKTLPVPRTSLVSAEGPLTEPAPDAELPHAVVPTATRERTAQANGPSLPARPKGTSNDEGAREAAVVALKRGDQAIRLGDIVSARRFYEFAASAGIAEAATAVGQTYDPRYLRLAGVRGVKANAETARGWYEKAVRQGDARATQLLQSLDQN